MRLKSILKLCAPILAAGTLMGCGSPEPTAEEVAATKARLEQQERERLANDVANYPTTATATITQLGQLGPRDVADMESAVEIWRLFDGAARNARIIDDAIEDGQINVPSRAAEANQRLKAILVQKQRQLFPEMRRTYAAYMSREVAGLQANFRAVGPGAKTLRAASPVFTSQEAVMDAHYTLASQAVRFRFTKAEYVYSLTGARDAVKVNGESDDDIGG